MTKQMDQEPTSRLRRRSFFEGIENDGIIAENMTTNDTDVAIATSMCNLPSDSENHPVSTSLLKQGNVTPSMSLYGGKILTEDQQELLCATSNSKTRMILQLLQTICSHVITGYILSLLAWTTRFSNHSN
ncbi:unnamed protein product [Peronospora belbahrii]|uniref:Uncharacterized protein n=1 Tax=Peronospora belbahrii TaxID=622444 RepID=A0ABN8CLE0_9STRA|nr:unnamed protein product [Peronospora belbahrii]